MVAATAAGMPSTTGNGSIMAPRSVRLLRTRVDGQGANAVFGKRST